jgi:hypothetical protein
MLRLLDNRLTPANIEHNTRSICGARFIKDTESDNKSENGAPEEQTRETPENIYSDNNMRNTLK